MTDPKPLVTHIYTADPSAHVFEGKLYIYPSHDRETDIPFNDNGDQYDMADYHVLSLSDPFESGSPPQVTDHGVALQASDVPWVSKQLWAPDAATKDGKYYLYFPARDKQGIFRIGVAVADRPEGPFKPDPEPIPGSYSIDPASFVDGDGQAYLYFGGIWGGQLQCWTKAAGSDAVGGAEGGARGTRKIDDEHKGDGEGGPQGTGTDEPNTSGASSRNTTSTITAGEWHFDPSKSGPQEPHGPDTPALLPRVAKLSADMRSFASAVQEIQILDPATGKLLSADDHDRRFFEAAWMHKYRGKYYFSYSTGDTHYVVYAVGDNPLGPFVYAGRILEPVSGWTTHHSIVEYRGKWWLFYHDCELSGGVDHLRSVKMRELVYDDQGRIRLKKKQE
ncbi:Beta-xylosidase [Exophiala dermatitidis]